MKNYMLRNAASHSSIVLSIVFIVLFVIDRVNPSMDFLGSEQSDWLLVLFCICSLTNGVITAANLYRRNNALYKREHSEHEHETEK